MNPDALHSVRGSDTLSGQAPLQPGGVRFVQGFVAILGNGAPECRLEFPAGVTDRASFCSSGRRSKVAHFGRTGGTMPVGECGQIETVFRGAPFNLSHRFDPQSVLQPGTVESSLWDLDGRFAVVVLDGDRGLAATDILGAGSLYWAAREGRLHLASHLGLILHSLFPENPPPLDQLGTASLLAGYCGLHGRTPFQGIRRLQSCEYLSMDLNHPAPADIQPKRYGDLADLLLTREFDAMTDADRVNHVGELIFDGIRREPLKGRIGLPLSGGRDSTSLAISLRKRFALQFEAITYGDKRSLDVIGSRRTARRLGIPHLVVDDRSWDYSTYADRIVTAGGGGCGLFGGSILVGYQECSQRYDRVLSGYLGGNTTGQHLPKENEPTLADVLDTIFNNRKRAPLRALYHDEISALESELDVRWRAYRSVTPTQAHMLIDFTERQTSYISCAFDLAETFVEMGHPLFTRKRLQFWFNCSPNHLRRQALYDRWLWAEIRRPAGAPASRKRGLPARVARRLLRALGLANTPPTIVDWGAITGKSMEWLRDTLADCDTDSRLRRLCELDLAAGYQPMNHVPDIVIALAPMLAINRLCRKANTVLLGK